MHYQEKCLDLFQSIRCSMLAENPKYRTVVRKRKDNYASVRDRSSLRKELCGTNFTFMGKRLNFCFVKFDSSLKTLSLQNWIKLVYPILHSCLI